MLTNHRIFVDGKLAERCRSHTGLKMLFTAMRGVETSVTTKKCLEIANKFKDEFNLDYYPENTSFYFKDEESMNLFLIVMT